jgi:hypothetical protein
VLTYRQAFRADISSLIFQSQKYLLEIFALFGRQHMRLPIVLDAYYRYVRRRTDRAQQVANEVFRLGTDLSVQGVTTLDDSPFQSCVRRSAV